MKKVLKHFELLNCQVSDLVTGLTGVVTSLAFDATGCVQVYITPRRKDDGANVDGSWVDVTRLEKLSGPVAPVANWENTEIAEGKKGSCFKSPK